MGEDFTYETLAKTYQDFGYPAATVMVKGKNLFRNKYRFVINKLEIELSSGYEASAAELYIYHVYDDATGKFLTESFSKLVELGAEISVGLGYLNKIKEVFAGYISGITYGYDKGDLPYVKITAMDVKGIMMANHESKQLKKASYGEALADILKRKPYEGLVKEAKISDTPDKDEEREKSDKKKASAYTVEMTAESDYEFAVKAAKRFNYEFFIDCGEVIFRKAKSSTKILAALGLNRGLVSFNISYRLDGLAEQVELRSLDAGTGKLLVSKEQRSGIISSGNDAGKRLKNSRKVVVDPSAVSQKQLNARCSALLESMSYRFGELNCECVGIPELVPGRFVKIDGLGENVSNQFYITKVVHKLDDEGFRTSLEGAAAQLGK